MNPSRARTSPPCVGRSNRTRPGGRLLRGRVEYGYKVLAGVCISKRTPAMLPSIKGSRRSHSRAFATGRIMCPRLWPCLLDSFR